MLYLILLVVFAAVGAVIFFLFKPAQEAMQRNVFRQKEHVARELEDMFIFISVEGVAYAESRRITGHFGPVPALAEESARGFSHAAM